MSTCPECNGTGKDRARTQAARKSGQCDAHSYIQCWSCNGNGNDTWGDFRAVRDRQKRYAAEE